LNFLDVTLINNKLINNKGKLEFDWYKKPTFSGRISYPIISPLKKEE